VAKLYEKTDVIIILLSLFCTPPILISQGGDVSIVGAASRVTSELVSKIYRESGQLSVLSKILRCMIAIVLTVPR